MSAAGPTVTLYTRPGCHLCDDARAVLERIRAEEPFALEERNIEEDDALHRAYLERIPVVALDGEELFDFFVDEGALRARLRGYASADGAGGAPERGAGPAADG